MGMRVNMGVGVRVGLRVRQCERKLAGRTGHPYVAYGIGMHVVECERGDGEIG